MSDSINSQARKLLSKLVEDSEYTLKMLSLELGRNHSYLQQYMTRTSPKILPEDVRSTLAEIFDIDPADLYDKGTRGNAPRQLSASSEWIEIPIYDVRASAGPGSIVIDSEPMDYRPFRLSDISRYDPASLSVIQVGGDSMWNTLHDGDEVLIDRRVNKVIKPGIYVLDFEGELIVKRCERDYESKSLNIISDNKDYPKQTITDASQILVYGRVIWIGRALR